MSYDEAVLRDQPQQSAQERVVFDVQADGCDLDISVILPSGRTCLVAWFSGDSGKTAIAYLEDNAAEALSELGFEIAENRLVLESVEE